MADTPRYTPEQLSILLRVAAGKLGRDPVKLQDDLQNGRLDGLLQSLGADREKVTASVRPGGAGAAFTVGAGAPAAAAAAQRTKSLLSFLSVLPSKT